MACYMYINRDRRSVLFISTSGKTKVNGETLSIFISALPHFCFFFCQLDSFYHYINKYIIIIVAINCFKSFYISFNSESLYTYQQLFYGR